MYADKGSGNQRQSVVSKKAQNQERNHASHVQEQTTLVTPKAGESIDQQKTLYYRAVFRHGKSQRPSRAEKHLRESEKSSQQNFCWPTINESSSSKCCIKAP